MLGVSNAKTSLDKCKGVAIISLILIATTHDLCTARGEDNCKPSDCAKSKVLQAQRITADAIPEDRPEAERLLNEAISIDPYAVEAFAELARYTLWGVANGLRTTADLALANGLALQVKDLAPDRPLGDYLLCESQIALGQVREAVQTCHLAEEAFPSHLDTMVFRARFFADSAPRLALEEAERALGSGVSYDSLSSSISLALSRIATAGTVGDTVARFANIYPDRWIWHRAGLAYTAEKRYADAASAFEKAIALGNTLESRLQLAILSYSQLKDYQRAIVEFNKLLTLLDERQNLKSETRTTIRAHLAVALLEGGKTAEAIALANDIIASDSDATSIMPIVYQIFTIRKLDLALAPALRKAISDNPFLLFAYTALGEIAAREKQHDEAISRYSSALALNSEQDDLYSARAHSYYALTNYQEALRDFDAAINIKPEEPSYHYNRACMLSLLGRKKEAIASLTRAFSMSTSLQRIAVTDADLETLRNDSSLQPQLAAIGFFDTKNNLSTMSNMSNGSDNKGASGQVFNSGMDNENKP